MCFRHRQWPWVDCQVKQSRGPETRGLNVLENSKLERPDVGALQVLPAAMGIVGTHGIPWPIPRAQLGMGKGWDLLRSLLKAPTSPMLVARSSRPCHFLATLGRRHITTPQLWPNLAANVCAEFVPLRSSRIRLSLSTTCESMHRWSRYLVFNLPSGKLT